MRQIKYLKSKIAITLLYLVILSVLWHFNVGCIYQRLFGISCPGCGMTRAVISALKLDFAAAFSYHRMFWSVPVLYLYFLFDGKLFFKKSLDRAVLIFIAVGFLLNWILNFV